MHVQIVISIWSVNRTALASSITCTHCSLFSRTSLTYIFEITNLHEEICLKKFVFKRIIESSGSQNLNGSTHTELICTYITIIIIHFFVKVDPNYNKISQEFNITNIQTLTHLNKAQVLITKSFLSLKRNNCMQKSVCKWPLRSPAIKLLRGSKLSVTSVIERRLRHVERSTL